MPYITKESLQAAKQMDLLTYLQLCDPQNLVHLSGDTYCTREHDSLKISNGKWHWFSRHIGGRSALDYLIKVKDFSLPMAVEQINGYSTSVPAISQPSQPKPKTICLPEPSSSTAMVRRYLKSRGIHDTVIGFCIDNDLLYEDKRYHSAVFLGRDSAGVIWKKSSICSTSTIRLTSPDALCPYRMWWKRTASSISAIRWAFGKLPLMPKRQESPQRTKSV